MNNALNHPALSKYKRNCVIQTFKTNKKMNKAA